MLYNVIATKKNFLWKIKPTKVWAIDGQASVRLARLNPNQSNTQYSTTMSDLQMKPGRKEENIFLNYTTLTKKGKLDTLRVHDSYPWGPSPIPLKSKPDTLKPKSDDTLRSKSDDNLRYKPDETLRYKPDDTLRSKPHDTPRSKPDTLRPKPDDTNIIF